MPDRLKRDAGGFTLETDPPTPEYTQIGWHCLYHINFCHNPLDCDLVPTWALTRDAAFARRKDARA